MTSLRKRKKQASRQGLPVPALELLELVEELLDAHRWLQVLGYANQFVLNEKLQIAPEERDRVLEAATRAVDKDARLADWRQRAAQLRVELGAVAAELPPPEPVAQPKPAPPAASPKQAVRQQTPPQVEPQPMRPQPHPLAKPAKVEPALSAAQPKVTPANPAGVWPPVRRGVVPPRGRGSKPGPKVEQDGAD